MCKLSIYYGFHLAINISLLIIFSSYIEFHILSVLPVFLIVLMFFQLILFKANTNNDTVGDTAYSVGNTVRLTDEEQTLHRLILLYFQRNKQYLQQYRYLSLL